MQTGGVEQWIAIIGLAITVVGAFVLHERRMGKMMTRAEHDAICDKRTEAVTESLRRIEEGVKSTHQRIDNLYIERMTERR